MVTRQNIAAAACLTAIVASSIGVAFSRPASTPYETQKRSYERVIEKTPDCNDQNGVFLNGGFDSGRPYVSCESKTGSIIIYHLTGSKWNKSEHDIPDDCRKSATLTVGRDNGLPWLFCEPNGQTKGYRLGSDRKWYSYELR